ncbi:MAG: FtsK/SpoIIIE domain-containing protein, partial [Peptococcaceae bacterium]|nr:FtsK/SpoIIIE domain-containing protein [Peptococcaceae bacterium]
MSVLNAYDKLGNLPKDCSLVIDVHDPRQRSKDELAGEIAKKITGTISEETTGKVTYDEQYEGKYYSRNNPSTVTTFISDVAQAIINSDPGVRFLLTYEDSSKYARENAIKLANIRLDTLTNAYQLPALVTFLEMYKAGKIEQLNPMTRWRENNPVKSLEAPVGISTTGDPFNLDIHEKSHGPHGLIAGMTGSGKSEFIMTFILSLAVNYHPHEVAFVLI